MKKLTALLLALVMIFSLTACDGTDGGKSRGLSGQHAADFRYSVLQRDKGK